jgi:site-specific recombinase XerD
MGRKKKLEHGESNLLALSEAIVSDLEKRKYSGVTIGQFRKACKELQTYAEERGIQDFTHELGVEFMRECHGYFYEGEPARRTFIQMRVRSMEWLSNFMKFGRIIRMGSLEQITVIPKPFSEPIDKYTERCFEANSTQRTVTRQLTYIYHFIAHVTSKSVTNPKNINAKNISEFAISLSKYSNSTISNTLSCLRRFLRFLYAEGYHDQNLSYSVPKPRSSKEKRLAKVWTEDEIERVLEQIDTGSPVGKRDYAMILLAVRLGIRSSDVCNLKLSDIKWETNKIEFTQVKTLIPNSLPLSGEVGIAIIDYLKNGRPKTKSCYMFLKPRPPYEKFEQCTPILKRYMKLAEISTPKHMSSGFHTLRHTLASKLLAQNVDLKFVSDILGHVDSNSAKYYLHVDIPGLRRCALSIGEVFCK